MVSGVLDESFDVLVLSYGVQKRIYCKVSSWYHLLVPPPGTRWYQEGVSPPGTTSWWAIMPGRKLYCGFKP